MITYFDIYAHDKSKNLIGIMEVNKSEQKVNENIEGCYTMKDKSHILATANVRSGNMSKIFFTWP